MISSWPWLASSTYERFFLYYYLNSFFFSLFVSLASLLSSNLNSIITLHYTCITLLFAQCESMLVAFVLVCPPSFVHSAWTSPQLSKLTSSSSWSFAFKYFLSLWIVYSVAPSHSICYDAGTNTTYIVYLIYSPHPGYLMFILVYKFIYVIFIYGKLQSVVGEPLLCVSILLLLHFVCRPSWCMLRQRCAGPPAVVIVDRRYPSSIYFIDRICASGMWCHPFNRTTFVVKCADVWCRKSPKLEAFRITFSK